MLLLTDILKVTDDAPTLALEHASLPILQITDDSRKVRAGALFVAIRGERADGAAYAQQAKQAGAIAIVYDKNTPMPDMGIPMIAVANPRRSLAQMAAAYYTPQPKHMVAVTGTDGKTSTADFFRQMMFLLEKQSASIGTLGVVLGNGEAIYPGSHTTPDPVALHKLLADIAGRGVEYACLEASSHGLHQHRLDGVQIEAAAFTNIARDHLDYHHTEEAYFAAKALLFDRLLGQGNTAVVNADDVRFPEIEAKCKARGIKLTSFGKQGREYLVKSIEPMPHGQRVVLELRGKVHKLDIPLVGSFQVMNILAAIGLLEAVGAPLEKAIKNIQRLQGVPGRLEQVVQLKNGASVYVDYAHTPLALASILKTLRPHTNTKLHVVFGCGGDRDTGKRPEMGKVACELADSIFVTDDNPRSEDPGTIRAAILAGCTKAREVGDRRDAIACSIRKLGPGDILVIAGKGHEKTQVVGDKTYPFDDAKVAREAAKEMAA